MRGANDVVEVWEHIYGDPENGFDDGSPKYMGFFSGLRPPKKDWEPGEVNKERLKSVHEVYFQWPVGMEQAEKWIQEQSHKGREVYHCAHLLTESKRKKENAAPVNALYVDGDGAKVSEGLPTPTLTIESSPNRDQYYWKLTYPVSPQKAEELNQRLAYAMGADKSGWDLTQLLRPPGTLNHKYEGQPSVEIKEVLDKAYNPEELDQILPRLQKDQKAQKKESKLSKGDSPSAFRELQGPPIVLDEYGMEVWQGNKVKFANDRSVDRSASLMKLGGVLYDAGATRKTIVAALQERDETLGWGKYTDRNADEEYHRIVNELECRERKDYSYAEKKGLPRQQKTSCIEFSSLGEIAEKGLNSPEELIEDVILAGKRHHIFSGAGNGKTFLALYITKKAIEQGKTVLYFDKENGYRIICERVIESLGADPKQVDEFLHYSPFPDLSTRDGLNEYLAVLDKKKPDLVIFDSWINFLSDSGLDENVSTDVAEWSVNFIHPAHERGIAVIMLDHVPKEGKGSARGSGRKKEEVDVQWELKKSKNFSRDKVGEIELRLCKDREGWLPNSVKFSVGGANDGFVFRRLGGASKEADDTGSELTDTARKILKVLQEHFNEEGATDAEWREASDEIEEVSRAGFYRAKKTLVEGEHYFKKGKKFYPQTPQEKEGE